MKKLLALFAACVGFGPFIWAQTPVAARAAPAAANAPAAAASAPAKRAFNPGPKAGQPAPELVAYAADGREVKLSDFRGKIVLLDIWATWCGPCVAAMPKNSELAEKYADAGLVVLAICASDTRENYDGWVARNADKYKFLTAHDRAGKDFANSEVSKTWGVSMFPSYFVIDRDGKIVGRAGGGGTNENPAVTRLLAKAGLPIPTDHLPPEKKPEPKSVPMMGMGAAPAAAPAAASAPGLAPAATIPTLRFANMAAGESVPDFSTTDAAGKAVKLSDFKGKTVFISFWTGSRNPPADVAALHAAYAAQGLTVWAINTATERADFEKWAKENAAALGHTVSWDPAGKAVMEAVSYMIFGAGMYPAYCVVGPDGKLVGGVIGMGGRVSGLLREIVGRAGIKLSAADQQMVETTLAAAAAAAKPASVPMGTIGAMAPAQKAPGAVTPPATLTAGAVAPDFTMRTADDREIKLSDFKGKVVVLDFWATWCGPCIASFPHTQEIAKKYKDQDVIVLASGTSDTIAKFKEWIPKNSPKYPDMVWAFDPNERGSATFEQRASSRLYGVSGIPTQFIIGRDGKITGVVVGNGGKEDARTEAALAAAGVKVDEATLAKGKEQVAKSAAAERERAAQAAIPRAPFFENFGRVKSGEKPAADPELLKLDGTPAKFSSVAPGKVLVLGVWSGDNGPGDAYLAAWRAWSAKYPDIVFAGLGGFAEPEGVREWQAKNAAAYSFPLYTDPTGKPPRPAKPADEMTDEETAAFRTASRAHYDNIVTVKLGGVMPPVPTTIVFGADGALAGWVPGFGPKYNDGLANLLLRAGVKVAAGDMPEKVWTKEEIAAATPKPEPRGEMLKIGAMAPDFTTQTLDGKDVKISDFKGKVVILDFWATWCGPCMTAMPHTQEVAKQYKDQGVVVLGSCTSDTRAKFEEWVTRNQEKYPDMIWSHDKLERSADRASNKLYGVRGIPTQFIIDRTGKIVDIVIGYQKGEVILDASLAKAGINVAPEIVEKAAKQRALRGN